MSDATLRFETVDCSMFGMAGLVRARIMSEHGADKIESVTEGHQLLDQILEGADQLGLTTANIEAVRTELVACTNLGADGVAVAQALSAVKLSKDFDPNGVSFVLDTDEPVNVPRGSIYAGDERVAVGSLANGWFNLSRLVGECEISSEQGIYLFQQMVAADMTLEQDDFMERLKGEERRVAARQIIEQTGPPRLEVVEHPMMKLLGFRRMMIHFDGRTFRSLARDITQQQLTDVASLLGDQMVEPLQTILDETTDLPADMPALMAAIHDYQLTEDVPSPIQFEQCMEEECYPLPHGHILHLGEQVT